MQIESKERIAQLFENGDKANPLSAAGALELAWGVVQEVRAGRMDLSELWSGEVFDPEGTEDGRVRFEEALATAADEHFNAGVEVDPEEVRRGTPRAFRIRTAYAGAVAVGAILGRKLEEPVGFEGETAAAFQEASDLLNRDAEVAERAEGLLETAFSATTSARGLALSLAYRTALQRKEAPEGEYSDTFPAGQDQNARRGTLMDNLETLLRTTFDEADIDPDSDPYASAVIHNFLARPSDELVAR